MSFEPDVRIGAPTPGRGVHGSRPTNQPPGTRNRRPIVKLALCALLALALGLAPASLPAIRAAGPTDIIGPPGSGAFGTHVVALPNGNLVIADPYYDLPGGTEDVGALYLYDGRSGALIGMLTGSHPGDRVGSGRVTVLKNGNYLVSSPDWDNGAAANAGAVTWGSGTTGITGTVSSANSLVGSHPDDSIGGGSGQVVELANGHYVLCSPDWDSGATADAGAVTWGSGATGISGEISAANSLVGSHTDDRVGSGVVVTLTSGNFVLASPWWDNDNGPAVDAGAVTWGNGMTGIAGTVSPANSLVGSHEGDWLGLGYPTSEYDSRSGIVALANGNYVVCGESWSNGTMPWAGAVTWGNGMTGITGTISTANSLVGSQPYHQIGWRAVPLSNGNYVVLSPWWNSGSVVNAGAVTWANGITGITGTVSAANSLIGSHTEDWVGARVLALSNGNYVVASPGWDDGAMPDVGAVTWGDGATGIVGQVSPVNSLVGSHADDQVGSLPAGPYGYVPDSVVALSNGNYVVASAHWDNDALAEVGAATWGNGATGITGTISASNSLIGSQDGDRVGERGVVPLGNGNYAVLSRYWANGAVSAAGAATWGNGATGIIGTVSATNSLVGSQAYDMVGDEVTPLSNGNYVVRSPYWADGAEIMAGAATWGNGMAGITGTVSAANSLVGSHWGDQVGRQLAALLNGNYVVGSANWSDSAMLALGAATWGSGTTGITGTISAANSLIGSRNGGEVGGDVAGLADGHYVVLSPYWDNGIATDAGAITLGDGSRGTIGVVGPANSVVGTAIGGGPRLSWTYDDINEQLVVGRPVDNIVTLWPASASLTTRALSLPLLAREAAAHR